MQSGILEGAGVGDIKPCTLNPLIPYPPEPLLGRGCGRAMTAKLASSLPSVHVAKSRHRESLEALPPAKPLSSLSENLNLSTAKLPGARG